MARRFIGTTLGTLIGAAALLAAGAAPASAAPRLTDGVDFTGIVALDNCSGSVIRPASAQDTDYALVMSNGHCVESGMPGPGQVIVDQPSSRTFNLLDSTGQNSLATLTATKIVYATMTDTDVSLYQLNVTYADIVNYGSRALTLATTHPTQGEPISVVSGYWQSQYTCAVDGFVYQLKEADWTWKDSVRYTSDCQPTHGTSGSPVIDTSTGQVVAVNNTGNDNGEQCTLDNPCEVDQNGNITVHQGTSYAEETFEINGCIGAGNTVDLTLPGCTLPKPSA